MTPERQALIDMVPTLMRLADGACTSYPYESCCRSCERLGEKALDSALDALSPYPGKDRWSEPPAAPQKGGEPRGTAWGAVTCSKCGREVDDRYTPHFQGEIALCSDCDPEEPWRRRSSRRRGR